MIYFILSKKNLVCKNFKTNLKQINYEINLYKYIVLVTLFTNNNKIRD